MLPHSEMGFDFFGSRIDLGSELFVIDMEAFLRLLSLPNLALLAIPALFWARENVFAKGPCDIYADGGTPCVAAYSTVRALTSAYGGPLYQVTRKSDNQTKDIPLLNQGGFINVAVQDSFLNGTTGTITMLYDQSGKGNNLPVSPPVEHLANGGTPVSATGGKTMVDGNTVFGIAVLPGAGGDGTGGNTYRNNKTKGVATGDSAEAMYMVVDGKDFNNRCCFDFGNVETSGNDDGPGTMETINWSNVPNWSTGTVNGPWVLADLENGVYAGSQSTGVVQSNTPIVASYVTTMLKGPSGNHFTLKGGDAQSGTLTTEWDGARPSGGYSPMRKEGAVELGTGGDGSGGGSGTFYEGAITIGSPADSIDNDIQANIVSAGYGRTVPLALDRAGTPKAATPIKFDYNPLTGMAEINYTLQYAQRVKMDVFNQQGRHIATIGGGLDPAGKNTMSWDAKRVRTGVYFCRVAMNGVEIESNKILLVK